MRYDFKFLIGICGNYDNMTSHVKELLDMVPVVDRCSTIVWKNEHSSAIYKARLNQTYIPDYLSHTMRM